jgi:mRNA interferase HigB
MRTWAVKVLNPRRLRAYEAAHPDASASLRTWWRATQAAEWASFNDVSQTFNTADQVGDRVIFNVRGGYYRLATWIDYDRKLVVMKWFGTHAAYDRGEWK